MFQSKTLQIKYPIDDLYYYLASQHIIRALHLLQSKLLSILNLFELFLPLFHNFRLLNYNEYLPVHIEVVFEGTQFLLMLESKTFSNDHHTQSVHDLSSFVQSQESF